MQSPSPLLLPKNKEPVSALIQPDFEFDMKLMKNYTNNAYTDSNESDEKEDQIFELDSSAKKKQSHSFNLGIRQSLSLRRQTTNKSEYHRHSHLHGSTAPLSGETQDIVAESISMMLEKSHNMR